MIDKKEIDEAARQYSSFLDDKDKRTAVEIGFKAGVDYVMDRWHSPKEKPDKDKLKTHNIVLERYLDTRDSRKIKRYSIIYNNLLEWSSILIIYSTVVRWAYLEDFMRE